MLFWNNSTVNKKITWWVMFSSAPDEAAFVSGLLNSSNEHRSLQNNALKKSVECVGYSGHDYLGMRKVCVSGCCETLIWNQSKVNCFRIVSASNVSFSIGPRRLFYSRTSIECSLKDKFEAILRITEIEVTTKVVSTCLKIILFGVSPSIATINALFSKTTLLLLHIVFVIVIVY